MKGSRCTCCGKYAAILYPYKRTKLCPRCLRIFVIDGIMRNPPIRWLRWGFRWSRRRRRA